MADIYEDDKFKGPHEAQADDLLGLHPEVKEAIVTSASSDVEKSGIKKGDPRHRNVLDLELALRLAQANEDHPGWQQGIRNLRIAQVKSKWGSQAPRMLQALGLQHRDAPAPTSKEEILLKYLKDKKVQEKESYTRGMQRELLDLKKAQVTSSMEDRKQKKAHKGLDKQILSRIDILKNAIKKATESLQLEHSDRLVSSREDANLEMDKLFDAYRIEDPSAKAAQMEKIRKGFDLLRKKKGL